MNSNTANKFPQIEPGSLITLFDVGKVEITTRNLSEKVVVVTESLLQGSNFIASFFELAELLTVIFGFSLRRKNPDSDKLPITMEVIVPDCPVHKTPMGYFRKTLYCRPCEEKTT